MLAAISENSAAGAERGGGRSGGSGGAASGRSGGAESHPSQGRVQSPGLGAPGAGAGARGAGVAPTWAPGVGRRGSRGPWRGRRAQDGRGCGSWGPRCGGRSGRRCGSGSRGTRCGSCSRCGSGCPGAGALPHGYYATVPTGWTKVYYGGYWCACANGVYYRPVYYQGSVVYVVVP